MPRSGKSTYARKLQQEGWIRVSPDEIRLALHGKSFWLPAEPLVWKVSRIMASVLLKDGCRVVIDATNISRERRRIWVKLSDELTLPRRFAVVVTPLETIYERCLQGGFPLEVIYRMIGEYEPVGEDEGPVCYLTPALDPAANPAST